MLFDGDGGGGDRGITYIAVVYLREQFDFY